MNMKVPPALGFHVVVETAVELDEKAKGVAAGGAVAAPALDLIDGAVKDPGDKPASKLGKAPATLTKNELVRIGADPKTALSAFARVGDLDSVTQRQAFKEALKKGTTIATLVEKSPIADYADRSRFALAFAEGASDVELQGMLGALAKNVEKYGRSKDPAEYAAAAADRATILNILMLKPNGDELLRALVRAVIAGRDMAEHKTDMQAIA